MKNNRRNFLKKAGIAGIGVAGSGILNGFSSGDNHDGEAVNSSAANADENNAESAIGMYGEWAYSLTAGKLPAFSFRDNKFKDIEKWRQSAKQRLLNRLLVPDIGPVPAVQRDKQYQYDDLHIEELSWQLPYGRRTEAILLRPLNTKGRLPAVLAFHDHGANKYFGKSKITRTSENRHPLIEAHQKQYYSDLAWANEIARRGYVVLVSDAMPFASRRVMLQDVPKAFRKGLDDPGDDDLNDISTYNTWAMEHEHTMAKSLFSAGTTWAGVFLAEDLTALDILCERADVDASRIGCGGLSGGGMRTVFMAGLDPRIKCAVCSGFMTTWKDFILNKSEAHTWMTFVPGLSNDLDLPEVLGLRAPLPTLVQNNLGDHLFTLSEMKASDRVLRAVYKKAGASGNYKCTFHPGHHKFDKKMQTEAFDWFDKWLKQ